MKHSEDNTAFAEQRTALQNFAGLVVRQTLDTFAPAEERNTKTLMTPEQQGEWETVANRIVQRFVDGARNEAATAADQIEDLSRLLLLKGPADGPKAARKAMEAVWEGLLNSHQRRIVVTIDNVDDVGRVAEPTAKVSNAARQRYRPYGALARYQLCATGHPEFWMPPDEKRGIPGETPVEEGFEVVVGRETYLTPVDALRAGKGLIDVLTGWENLCKPKYVNLPDFAVIDDGEEQFRKGLAAGSQTTVTLRTRGGVDVKGNPRVGQKRAVAMEKAPPASIVGVVAGILDEAAKGASYLEVKKELRALLEGHTPKPPASREDRGGENTAHQPDRPAVEHVVRETAAQVA